MRADTTDRLAIHDHGRCIAVQAVQAEALFRSMMFSVSCVCSILLFHVGSCDLCAAVRVSVGYRV